MKDYSKHFLLDINTTQEYVKDVLNIFGREEDLLVEEIGDGNINYVFRVSSKDGAKSVVIKQADSLLRSSQRPLDLYRNKIESEILRIEGELCEGFVPKIYYYDENMYALCMEDISECKNLRKELMNNKVFPKLAEDISTFLVNTLLPTTDLVLDRAKKKEYVKLFINPDLCDISEDLVFTEPYFDYKDRNIITSGNESYVEEVLYNDKKLHTEVGLLRNNFMNNAQALIHGDLHSGSIFANEDRIVVIDPEFAFYGPIGYDVGNVIGNLIFAWANCVYVRDCEGNFDRYIKNTISEMVDQFLFKFKDKYDEVVQFPLYLTDEFKKKYLDSVLADSIGYAGTEIIRRVVGDSKVLEVSSVSDLDIKIPMERKLIEIGKNLIMNRDNIHCGEEVTKLLVK